MPLHNAKAAALKVGEQTIDGLGRQASSTVGGRETLYGYTPLSLPPRNNTLPNGHVIAFAWEPQLDNALISLTASANDTTLYRYDPHHSQLIEASGKLGRQNMAYTASGKLQSKTWTVEGEEHVHQQSQSLSGRLCSLSDAAGIERRYEHDQHGRLIHLQTGNLSVTIEYDDFSRESVLTTRDTLSGNRLKQTLSYDDFGRETDRRLEITQSGSSKQLTQSLGYDARDQVTQRIWTDGASVAEEHYGYDSRGRLITYTANDAAAPSDPFGNRIRSQTFVLNALDGNRQVTSTFADGSSNIATFSYSDIDPAQVVRVDHSHASWPATLTLKYDECGNVTEDGMGRTLSWDEQNRLIKVSQAANACDYRYAPGGELGEREHDGLLTRLFYADDRLIAERQGSGWLSYLSNGSEQFAQSRLGTAVRNTLLGCDIQGTVRIEADDSMRTPRYTAHGAGHSDDLQSPIGFAGERADDFTGWYLPGSYRPYDPVLMCFLSPDSESPFGRGGLNAYAYCGGDPVNNIDPDGHGWFKWLLAGVGIVAAVAATVATFGAAGAAIGAVMAGGIGALTVSGAGAIAATGLSVASVATGVASVALEASGADQKAANILGWVSLGTGLAAGGFAGVSRATSNIAASTAGQLSREASLAGRGQQVIRFTRTRGLSNPSKFVQRVQRTNPISNKDRLDFFNQVQRAEETITVRRTIGEPLARAPKPRPAESVRGSITLRDLDRANELLEETPQGFRRYFRALRKNPPSDATMGIIQNRLPSYRQDSWGRFLYRNFPNKRGGMRRAWSAMTWRA